MSDARIPVALGRLNDYAPAGLDKLAGELFDAIDFAPAAGTRVLVKPNLLRAGKDGLICTHPDVAAAACRYLLDCGAKVRVGDSIGFGTATSVADKIGLSAALAPLGLKVETLDRPRRVRLPFGYGVGISRDALEAGLILNLPKLKCHGQMGMTLAVKNLFGCVVGTRKALAHSMHGDVGNRFESLIVEVAEALPPVVSLLDGVSAMHVTGPTGGEPYPLGLLGASQNAVALDTTVYTLLGLDAERLPVWRELIRRGRPGARMEDVQLLGPARPEAFDVSGFETPLRLDPATFHPVRLVQSVYKRFVARVRS